MSAINEIQVFFLEKFVPFVILLGLLIFVHELGHFLVAKYYKVRVEVFSLGFGKKIFKFIKGHTTYCIALIPLGGYVKMFGDDPSAKISEHEKAESFSHKPVGQRIAIVLAGPLMNLFFAVVLFMGVGLNGEKAVGPILGDIDQTSQAWSYGFRPNDKIVSIDGISVKTWKEVNQTIQKSIGRNLEFELQRSDQNVSVQAKPVLSESPDVLQWEENVGEIQGLSPLSSLASIGISANSSLAYQSGLRSLDQIVKINDQKIKTWSDLVKAFDYPKGSEKFKVTVDRGSRKKSVEKEIELRLTEKMRGLSGEKNLAELGVEKSDLYIYNTAEGTPAAQAGFQKGDLILSINDKKISRWIEVPEIVNSYKSGDPPLRFGLIKDGQPHFISVSPKENTFMDENGAEVTKFQIGIAPAIFKTVANPVIIKADSLVAAIQYGVQKTIEWTKTIVISFVRMLQAKVSPKNIGGVFTIGQLASETFKMGLSPYLQIMAIISINLFIINLLPIPILDGGHLLFFSIEALRGAPLSMKKMEMAQQIGLILLMSLMAYAIFNDISRIW